MGSGRRGAAEWANQIKLSDWWSGGCFFSRGLHECKRLEPGDLLLVYRNSVSRHIVIGRAGAWRIPSTSATSSGAAARRSTSPSSKTTYNPIDVKRATVNELLGYEEAFWPQGLWRVRDDRPAAGVAGPTPESSAKRLGSSRRV